MCEAKPGLRCLPHASKDLAKAKASFEEKEEAIKEGGSFTAREINAFKRSVVAFDRRQREFDTTVLSKEADARSTLQAAKDSPPTTEKDREHLRNAVLIMHRITQMEKEEASRLAELRVEAVARQDAGVYLRAHRSGKERLPETNTRIVSLMNLLNAERREPLSEQEKSILKEAESRLAAGSESPAHMDGVTEKAAPQIAQKSQGKSAVRSEPDAAVLDRERVLAEFKARKKERSASLSTQETERFTNAGINVGADKRREVGVQEPQQAPLNAPVVAPVPMKPPSVTRKAESPLKALARLYGRKGK